MRVYLAGPITDLQYRDTMEWREAYAARIQAMGHIPISPMRGKEYLSRVRRMRREGYGDHPTSSPKGIYSRDCFDVRTCEVTLARLLGAEIVSIGTVMEIQRAHDYGRYILVVMEKKDNIHRHAFLEEACSLIVETDEEAFEVLEVLGEGYVDHVPEVPELSQEPN